MFVFVSCAELKMAFNFDERIVELTDMDREIAEQMQREWNAKPQGRGVSGLIQDVFYQAKSKLVLLIFKDKKGKQMSSRL